MRSQTKTQSVIRDKEFHRRRASTTSVAMVAVLAGWIMTPMITLPVNAQLPTPGVTVTPEASVGFMTVPEGLEVKLVANEPDIRQPVSMSFDSRGRMWVVQ